VRNFVYVLGTRDRLGSRTYVGWTNDVARRLQQHNGGRGARSTRGRQWILLHVEAFPTRTEAMSREQRLKRDRTLRAALRAELPAM
jgi:putative endonuclease